MLFYLMCLSKLFILSVDASSNDGVINAVTDAYLPNVDGGRTDSDVCVFPVNLVSFLIVECEIFWYCCKTHTNNLSML
jgi:hypothetical protein